MTEQEQKLRSRFLQIKQIADSGAKILPEDFKADRVDEIYFRLCAVHWFNNRGRAADPAREQRFIDQHVIGYLTDEGTMEQLRQEGRRLNRNGFDAERLSSRLCKPWDGSYKEMLAALYRYLHFLSGESEPVTAKRIMQQTFPMIWTGGSLLDDLEKQNIFEETGFDPWKGVQTDD